MRIIGGKLKGLQLHAPKNLPVRPTTDMAKEALFNIITNTYALENCRILDLFCGTGNISFEFASRGILAVDAVDRHFSCVKWVQEIVKKHTLDTIQVYKADVFKYIAEPHAPYDIIFADPPYDLPAIPQLPKLIYDNNMLNNNGVLIIEHPSLLQLNNQPHFKETRSYGHSSFSFFKQQN